MLSLRKKILVAIDGSPQSDKAAEEAVRLAAGNQSQFKSRIYALLVLPNAPASTYTDFVPEAPLEMIIEYGDPAERIIALAKREEIDVIVIGSSGKGFIQRKIMGSVSHKVASNAACSVFIVRG